MTDNEIIMALEYCYADENNCKRCPYMAVGKCHKVHTRDVLDLINRQKAEIERLEAIQSSHLFTTDFIRYKAVKEFAERLKSKEKFHYDYYSNIAIRYIKIEDIDNLVKEMVGDTE